MVGVGVCGFMFLVMVLLFGWECFVGWYNKVAMYGVVYVVTIAWYCSDHGVVW